MALIGSKEGIGHVAFAYVDPGDEALVPDPGYPVYAASARLAGGTPVSLPALAERGFVPDLSMAAVSERTKTMWLGFPRQPDGRRRRSHDARGGGGLQPRTRRAAAPRRRVLRDHLRRLRRAVRAPGPRREGRRARVRLDVEVLQHDRVADRVGGRIRGGHRGARRREDEPGQRTIHRRPARGDRRARGTAGSPRRAPRDLPTTARPRRRHAERARLVPEAAARIVLRLGSGARGRDLGGLRRPAARRRRRLRRAGQRVRGPAARDTSASRSRCRTTGSRRPWNASGRRSPEPATHAPRSPDVAGRPEEAARDPRHVHARVAARGDVASSRHGESGARRRRTRSGGVGPGRARRARRQRRRRARGARRCRRARTRTPRPSSARASSTRSTKRCTAPAPRP